MVTTLSDTQGNSRVPSWKQRYEQPHLQPNDLVNLDIESLGACIYKSPLTAIGNYFVNDTEKVYVYSNDDLITQSKDTLGEPPAFEIAGPCEKNLFWTSKINCGIVTCRGFCPGLNDVIKSIAITLTQQYKVNNVLGFRYGYQGLARNATHPPITLTPEIVDNIHNKNVTISNAL